MTMRVVYTDPGSGFRCTLEMSFPDDDGIDWLAVCQSIVDALRAQGVTAELEREWSSWERVEGADRP